MAQFRAHITPNEAYPEIKKLVRAIRNQAGNASTRLASGSDGEALTLMHAAITSQIAHIDILKVVPKLAEYALEQEDDATYDAVQAFTDMRATLMDALATIEAVNTNALIDSWNASGGITWNTFTAGQTSALQADMDAIVAGILIS